MRLSLEYFLRVPNVTLSKIGYTLGAFFLLTRDFFSRVFAGDVMSGEGNDLIYWTSFDAFTNLAIISFLKALRFSWSEGIYGFMINVGIGVMYGDLIDRVFFSRYTLAVNDLIFWIFLGVAMWIKHRWEIVRMIVDVSDNVNELLKQISKRLPER